MIFNYILVTCLILIILAFIYYNFLIGDFNEFENKQKNINLANYEALREINVELSKLRKEIIEIKYEAAKETNKKSERNNR